MYEDEDRTYEDEDWMYEYGNTKNCVFPRCKSITCGFNSCMHCNVYEEGFTPSAGKKCEGYYFELLYFIRKMIAPFLPAIVSAIATILTVLYIKWLNSW